MGVEVGDAIEVRFSGVVERIGDSGTGRRYVFVNGLWIAPEEYHVIEVEEK